METRTRHSKELSYRDLAEEIGGLLNFATDAAKYSANLNAGLITRALLRARVEIERALELCEQAEATHAG